MAQFKLADFTLYRQGPRPTLVTEDSDLRAEYAIAGVPNEFMVQGQLLNVRYARAAHLDVYEPDHCEVIARVWQATPHPDVSNVPDVHILND